MQIQGLTRACGALWERGATALIGISPFNSHFDEARIRRLLTTCRRDGREALVFVPDEVTRHTLAARGYPPARAETKLRRQLNYLRNKVVRAADGQPPPILGCGELDGLPEYRARLGSFTARFEADPAFRAGCLATTRWVLQASPEEPVAESAALLGVRYLLAELPLFLQAPAILGRDGVVFVYHQVPAFIASLYRGEHGPLVGAGQGFVTLTD
jgi:cyclo(L-tyrosyl-L-tyrosyl) synthase